MSNNAYMKKSKSDNWGTPLQLFHAACEHFKVKPELDVCASDTNHKCWDYITEEQNAFSRNWNKDFFMNCPFSQAKHWIQYAYQQHRKFNVNGLCLLASRTDTQAWHRYIFNDSNCEVLFLEGRIHYLDENNIASKNPSPFPSAFVLWRKF